MSVADYNCEDLVSRIKAKVYDCMDLREDVNDEQLKELIGYCVRQESKNSYITVAMREDIEKQLFNSIRKFDVIQELLDDDRVTEIMINGCRDVFVEKDGRITKWSKSFDNSDKLQDVAQRIAGMSNKLVNESVPIVDTRLVDGSRVNIVLKPIAIDGPVITIRKFYETPLTMEHLISINSVSEEAAVFLKNAVKARYNIFISGDNSIIGLSQMTFRKKRVAKT